MNVSDARLLLLEAAITLGDAPIASNNRRWIEETCQKLAQLLTENLSSLGATALVEGGEAFCLACHLRQLLYPQFGIPMTL